MYGVAFVNRTLYRVIVFGQHIQMQNHYAVATDGIAQGVAILACCSELLTVEVIRVSLADLAIDRLIGRFVHYQLQAVEHTLAVHIARVVAIDTCRVERSLCTVPFIGPNIRQIIATNGNGGINQLMYEQLKYGRAVTSLRRSAEMEVGAGRAADRIEERYLLAFEDMLRTGVEVGLMNRQVQGHD